MLTELLGFVPQLLLDDIADAATDTVNNAIEGLEDYLRKWISSREQQPPSEDLEAEVENGLLEFHTLLCGHRDMSIDMLETWSMRNVFFVPPELKIVMPHQRGLDLSTAQGRDVKAQVELDVLRRKIENARKFQAQLKQADEVTLHRLARSQERLEKLKFLQTLDPTQVESLPTQIRSLLSTIRTLPATAPPLPSSATTGPRQHTESRPEFLDWAIRRLVSTNTSANGTSAGSEDLGGVVSGVRSDEEGEDEVRLVGTQEEQGQEKGPETSGTKSGVDLSVIHEGEQDEDATQRLALPSSQPLAPSSSQLGPSSSQVTSSSQPIPSSQPQNISINTTISDASTSTISTVKRRRSSMLPPGVGAKRRRSSLGLAERARAGNASANGSQASANGSGVMENGNEESEQ